MWPAQTVHLHRSAPILSVVKTSVWLAGGVWLVEGVWLVAEISLAADVWLAEGLGMVAGAWLAAELVLPSLELALFVAVKTPVILNWLASLLAVDRSLLGCWIELPTGERLAGETSLRRLDVEKCLAGWFCCVKTLVTGGARGTFVETSERAQSRVRRVALRSAATGV